MIRVLLSIKVSPSDKNPYMSLFSASIAPYVNIVQFSWRNAIFGRYDVVHFHWPEYIFRGSSRLRAVGKFVLASVFLARLRVQRVPVYLTVHNERPHEVGDRSEQMLLTMLEKLVVLKIYLNEDPSNTMDRGVVLLHGPYPSGRDIPSNRNEPHQRNDVFFFGQIRPYKGIESLISAFGELKDAHLRLLVVGDVVDSDYGDRIREVAARDDRIVLRLQYMEDEVLTETLRSCRLVVLPYRSMYNSGAVIRALGEGAQVLVPRSGSTVALQSEVGKDWVQLFNEHVRADDLRSALSLKPSERRASFFARRDWGTVGKLQAKVYRFGLDSRNVSRSVSDWRHAVRSRLEADVEFAEHSTLNSVKS